MAENILERAILWGAWSGPRLEHLRFRHKDKGTDLEEIIADGVVLGFRNLEPFRLEYRMKLRPDWTVRKLEVDCLCPGGRERHWLHSDGDGNWHDELGNAYPELAGCVDVDIAATP